MAIHTSINWVHLAPNPNSFYRQLFIQGTRIRARVIYGLYMNADEPMTPEEIAADLGLSLDAVKEAITYCQSNPPEIDEDYRREETLMEATGMNDPNYRNHGKPKPLTAQEMARIRSS